MTRKHLFGIPILSTSLLLVLTFSLPAFADHIHHLYYNNSIWQDQDLTTLTGGGIATSFGGIAAFYTTPNNQLHVYYVDSTYNHVHELYFNNTSWSDSDLTAMTSGLAASPYGLSGFAIGNLQHVFYYGSDSQVHQLYYNNASWVDQNISGLAGGPLAGAGPIVAFATTPNDQFHVYYEPLANLDLHQLYFNGTSWSDSDLTSITGTYCYTDWMAGFAVGNFQDVLCPGVGSNGFLNMQDIYYNNITWLDQDVTTKVGGLPLYLGGGVAAFQVPGARRGEVYGVTSDTHIHQFDFIGGRWDDTDLTGAYGAPADGAFGGIVAFATTPNDQYHIYYAPSTEVYQIYYTGSSWSVEDLTGGAGQADDNSGMAGFSIGNLQHVFYMSSGN